MLSYMVYIRGASANHVNVYTLTYVYSSFMHVFTNVAYVQKRVIDLIMIICTVVCGTLQHR